MANQRLINCDFFLKGAFDDVSSIKAKLLYFYLFINADDLGFVGNANKIIKSLNEENGEENGLVDYTFENAADELVDRGYLYRFIDKHQNQILLIRHFFMHNKYNGRYCTTNYISLRAKVELVDGCYEMKELKEKPKGKEINKTNNAIQTNNEEEKEEVEGWDDTMKELEDSMPKNPNNMTFEEILKLGDTDDEN